MGNTGDQRELGMTKASSNICQTYCATKSSFQNLLQIILSTCVFLPNFPDLLYFAMCLKSSECAVAPASARMFPSVLRFCLSSECPLSPRSLVNRKIEKENRQEVYILFYFILVVRQLVMAFSITL